MSISQRRASNSALVRIQRASIGIPPRNRHVDACSIGCHFRRSSARVSDLTPAARSAGQRTSERSERRLRRTERRKGSDGCGWQAQQTEPPSQLEPLTHRGVALRIAALGGKTRKNPNRQPTPSGSRERDHASALCPSSGPPLGVPLSRTSIAPAGWCAGGWCTRLGEIRCEERTPPGADVKSSPSRRTNRPTAPTDGEEYTPDVPVVFLCLRFELRSLAPLERVPWPKRKRQL